MFDGVPDQFHQFITQRTSLPLHLPFPLHSSAVPSNSTFHSFDPYNPLPHQLPLQLQPNLLHQLHHQHQPSTHKEHEAEKEEHGTVPMNFEIDQRDQSIDPWTNDEVLALLRIRSSMESWFPELTWEHVSRKLAELGYKRSAEKCKEKFEEESRYFNNINYTNNNNNNNNNYRFHSELEELYNQGDNRRVGGSEKPTSTEEGQDKIMDLEEGSATQKVQGHDEEGVVVENPKEDMRPKRKKPDRFEMFKGFCESIVHKMMEQQEEMHNKLIKDMLKRDEEKLAKEEAWKKQEMDRMNQELEIMAQEQAIACDRQANMIEFLNKFSKTTSSPISSQIKVTNVSNPNTCTTPSSPPSQNPNPSNMVLNNRVNNASSEAENPSSIPTQETLQNASSTTSPPIIQNPTSPSLNRQNNTNSVSNKASPNVNVEKDGVGRRWPKDEVLALINLRCSSLNNNSNEEMEGNKAPLWERISQGMLELGYKRSSRRCKEKWENINKYFRKTKDDNKKRSLDSRTCPYFHQLSNLYNQGKLVLQSERLENKLSPQENTVGVSTPDQNQSKLAESCSQVGSGGFSVDHHEGEKTLMHVPSLDFDQF
ncbi:hypothetical protein Lal_00047769 [Lupinus albus]|uniref:Putative transcription factor MYB family n=1 Tax=Lupinus albus TaxID=3870 RepID=A0A6A4R0Z0_LUPAL|nr:putative transcription factor MYB family [Lupinus albus]KAF1879097.1 hypothetical protein Lal_00047769 [Lupinus albus]